jgi:hypothetical protein
MGKLKTAWMLLAVAAATAGVGSGCGSYPEEVDEASLDTKDSLGKVQPLPLPICRHGMTTELHTMLPPSAFQFGLPKKKTCQLKDLPELVNHVCQKADDPVCTFLNEVFDGHGRVQCTRYLDQDGTPRACADVVDKDPNGAFLGEDADADMLNFMIGYSAENPKVPSELADMGYWDGRLAGGIDTLPPVSLSVVGHYYGQTMSTLAFQHPEPPMAQRWFRALKFDPRDCGDCTIYDGPNISSVDLTAIVSLATWVPQFDALSCRFQPKPLNNNTTSWVLLDPAPCLAETHYRAVGR